jgi:hypothetical protein
LSANTVAQNPDGSVMPPLLPGQLLAGALCGAWANADDPTISNANNDVVEKAAARSSGARKVTRSNMAILPVTELFERIVA